MKEIQQVTPRLWADQRGRPWYTRLFWAEVDGRWTCVGIEARTARFVDEPTDSQIADFATEEQAARGRFVQQEPAGVGGAHVLRVDKGWVNDLPPAELNGEALRALRVPDLLAATMNDRRNLAAFFEPRAERRREMVEQWAAAGRPLRSSPGRPKLDERRDLLGWAVAAYEAALEDGFTPPKARDVVAGLAATEAPGKHNPEGVHRSTVGRWLKAARAAGLDVQQATRKRGTK